MLPNQEPGGEVKERKGGGGRKRRKREEDGFRGVEARGYWGG